MSRAIVRRARSEDLDDVLLLWLGLMSEHEQLDPRLAVADGAGEIMRDRLLQVIDSDARRLFVAAVDGDLVGYASGSVVENTVVFRVRYLGHISDMYVAPPWRRQGIGRQLFVALRRWFRGQGLTSIELNVATLNPVGQTFWTGLGFSSLSQRLWMSL